MANDNSAELTKDQAAYLGYFSDIPEFNKYDIVGDSLAGFTFDKFFRNYMYYEHDYGGFIIITDKQHLVGFNKNKQGVEHHCDAIAKIYMKLHNLPDLPCATHEEKLKSQVKAVKYFYAAGEEYICARFDFEKKSGYHSGSNEFEKGKPNEYSGVLSFDITKTKINYKNVKQFIKFYEAFNEDIAYYSKHFDFPVEFVYENDKKDVSHSLDNILKYLENYLVEHKEALEAESINPNEEIIDVPKSAGFTIS